MENIEIKVYQVKCGDCFYVRYSSDDKKVNIFIDAGFSGTYKTTFKKDIKEILEKGEKIDLFVITHIDQDHISGIKPFLKEFGIDKVENFWFNHYDKLIIPEQDIETEIGVKDGIILRDHFQMKGREMKEIIAGDELIIADEIKFKILSPSVEGLKNFKDYWKEEEPKYEFKVSSKKNSDYNKSIEELLLNTFKEDDDIANGSSIAFLLEIGTFKCLFSADAYPSVLYDSLQKLGYTKEKPLKLDFLKVPHHGSKRNLSNELLEILDCQNFIFSANGINRDYLPNKETVARIVSNSTRNIHEIINLHFNYDNEYLQSIRTNSEEKKFNFKCVYSNHLKINYEIFRESI